MEDKNQKMTTKNAATRVVKINIASTGKVFRLENLAGSSTGRDLKEIMRAKIDMEISDQRLVQCKGKPILDDQAIGELGDEEKELIVLLYGPLKKASKITVQTGEYTKHMIASGSDTTESVKRIFGEGRVLFRGLELDDDTKTLDYYQVFPGSTLDLKHESNSVKVTIVLQVPRAYVNDRHSLEISPSTTVKDLIDKIHHDITINWKKITYNGKEMIEDIRVMTYLNNQKEPFEIILEGKYNI